MTAEISTSDRIAADISRWTQRHQQIVVGLSIGSSGVTATVLYGGLPSYRVVRKTLREALQAISDFVEPPHDDPPQLAVAA